MLIMVLGVLRILRLLALLLPLMSSTYPSIRLQGHVQSVEGEACPYPDCGTEFAGQPADATLISCPNGHEFRLIEAGNRQELTLQGLEPLPESA